MIRKERKKNFPKVLVGIGIGLIILATIFFLDANRANRLADAGLDFRGFNTEAVKDNLKSGIFSAVSGVVCIVIGLIKNKKI